MMRIRGRWIGVLGAAAAIAATVLPVAIAGEKLPQAGSWYTSAEVRPGGSGVLRGGFRVLNQKPRKVTAVSTDAPLCAGGFTRLQPDGKATVKGDGGVYLKDRVNFTDGFQVIELDGRFTSKTQFRGSFKVKIKVDGTGELPKQECSYSMKIGRSSLGGYKPPKGR